MAGSNFFVPISSTCDVAFVESQASSGLAVFAKCTGTPPTTASTFEHGCLMIRTDSGTGNAALYENTGSSAVPSWNLVGAITPGEITLAEGSILVGNSSGVAAAFSAKTTTQILIGNGTTLVSAALSGDATMTNAGVVTVASAAAAFNVGTNQTWTKEVNHTSAVAASTTAATVGGSLAFAGGAGNTSGTGGAISVTAGIGGATGAGGAASLVGGAGGGGNTNGGAVAVTGGANAGNGTAGTVAVAGGAGGSLGTGGGVTLTGGSAGSTPGAVSMTGGAANLGNGTGGTASSVGGAGIGTGAGGAVLLTSGTSANGTAVNPGASGAITISCGTAGTATTGTGGAGGAVTVTGAAGGASTGASSTGGAGSDITLTAGAGGASSGGGDTGGRGGNVIQTAGSGGSGATPGRDGMFFRRGAGYSQKVTVTALTTSATLVTQQMMAGMFTANQGGAAGATYTTPTGGTMAGILPLAFTTGDSFDFTITNISTNAAEIVTLAAGATGITLAGNMTVAANNATTTANTTGIFRVVCTGGSAYTIYRIS